MPTHSEPARTVPVRPCAQPSPCASLPYRTTSAPPGASSAARMQMICAASITCRRSLDYLNYNLPYVGMRKRISKTFMTVPIIKILNNSINIYPANSRDYERLFRYAIATRSFSALDDVSFSGSKSGRFTSDSTIILSASVMLA